MKSDRPKTLFVCGVAGVGKTYLINRVIGRSPTAVTCRASAIIQEARRAADPDALRRLPVDEIALSQELLIDGLNRMRSESAATLIVLDGHSVIDTEGGFFDIAVETMRRLCPQAVVHVEDAVERIDERRAVDTTRSRPRRSLEQLAEYQSRSLAMCRSYEMELSIPLIRLRTGDEPGLEKVISDMVAPDLP